MKEIEWTPSQRDAIEADGCSISVSAAAGSGKTTVLARRILERVRDRKIDVSRILVVTFTREAAMNLTESIEGELSAEYAKNPDDKWLELQLLLFPSAKVCTIDSFCLDLIRENFSDTGISGFGVIDADSEKLLKAEVMDELISDYFDGNVTGSRRIDDFGTFADILGSPSSDTELCLTMLDIYEKYSTVIDVEKAIRGEEGYSWRAVATGYIKEFFEHFIKVYNLALAEIESTPGASGWQTGFEVDWDFCKEAFELINSGCNWKNLEDEIKKYKSIKTRKLGSVSEEDKTEKLLYFKKCREGFISGIEEIISMFFPQDADFETFSEQKTAELQEKTIAFISEFSERLFEEKKRRRVIGFGDIERIALKFLYDAENDCKTKAAEDISQRFDEIYIDEFQDTNSIQDTIFKMISREDNLFTVGDIKQSIYAFRGADSSIFSKQTDSREKYDKNVRTTKAKVFLSENFRSYGEIIDMVNGVFDVLMNEKGNERYGVDERLNCGKKENGNIKYAGVLPEIDIIRKDEENGLTQEAFVAAKIAEMIASNEAKPGEIAVLSRNNKTVAAVTEALTKAKIPCKNTEDRKYFSSPEVLLMLSVLNTVDNPSRDIYLAGALKSRIYGVTTGELVKIKRCKNDGSLFSALKKYTEENCFEKGERFLADHEKFKRYARLFPCGEFVRRVYDDTKIMSVVSSGKNIAETEMARANLRRLYDYAREFERNGDGGLYGFISFINGLAEGGAKTDISRFASAEDGVSVMTIHASKGLQFKVCFLCKAHSIFDRRDLTHDVIPGRKSQLAMQLIRDGKKYDTPMRNAVARIEEDTLTSEELKLLYVALTRAERRLFIVSENRDIEKARTLYDFTRQSSICATEAETFSAYMRKNSRNYLSLLCLALSKRPGLCTINFVTELPQVEYREDTGGDSGEASMTREEAERLVRERLDFVYPYMALSGVPSKLSVSRLKPDILDDASEGTLDVSAQEDAEEVVPLFMREGALAVSAAEKGTSMHTFMQFFNFDSVRRLGVDGEIERMVEKKFIFESDAQNLDREKLQRFFDSDLARQMEASKKSYREKRFIVYYPAERFSDDETLRASLKGEKLLVQGVIDCAFINDAGELILVDYKTDSFDAGLDERHIKNILKKRHFRQLDYYRYACEQMFKMPVAHTYIYSFALDGAVEL